MTSTYEITGSKPSYKAFKQWVYNDMHHIQRKFFTLSKLILKNPVFEVWLTSPQSKVDLAEVT